MQDWATVTIGVGFVGPGRHGVELEARSADPDGGAQIGTDFEIGESGGNDNDPFTISSS